MQDDDRIVDELSTEEVRDLVEDMQLDVSPEQMRAILAFIEQAGGVEEAQELLESLRKAA